MISDAGFYLRDTMYAARRIPSSDLSGPNGVERKPERKYFKRVSTERKSLERRSIDRTSIAPRSSEAIINGFSSLSTAFGFVDFVASLGSVSSEIEVFANLIQRVRQDLDEALRLLLSHVVVEYYEAYPDRRSWIDNVLLDVQRALNDIGVYVENVRVGGTDGGGVKTRRKFEWVLSHHQKLISRELALTTCHQSLMVALRNMQDVEMEKGFRGYELEGAESDMQNMPPRPWLQPEDGLMRSPYSRQKWRISQRNLSVPSIAISEPSSDKLEVLSTNIDPAELQGSTPQDLPDPDNWDLYAAPPRSRKSLEQPPVSPMFLEDVRSHRSLDQLRCSSPDQGRPLSTLIEKAPEAIESIEGSEDGGSMFTRRLRGSAVPLLARRFKPKAVHIRKPSREKHHSLPVELPHLPPQTSLITELSRWVLPSADKRASVAKMFESPSQIAVSPDLPTSPASCPATISMTANPTLTSTPDFSQAPACNHSPIRDTASTKADAPALTSLQMVVESFSPDIQKEETVTSEATNPLVDPLGIVLATPVTVTHDDSASSVSSVSTTPTAFEDTPPIIPAAPLTHINISRKALPLHATTSTEVLCTPSVLSARDGIAAIEHESDDRKDMADPGPTSQAEAQESTPQDSAADLERPANVVTAPVTMETAPPVIAQVKRRRAQARRMQLAYGLD